MKNWEHSQSAQCMKRQELKNELYTNYIGCQSGEKPDKLSKHTLFHLTTKVTRAKDKR